GTGWTLQQVLAPADGANNQRFGGAVAIDGNTVLVGANSPFNAPSGGTYVFVRSGATWTQQQRLAAPDGFPNDDLGLSVALSGDTAVVGAPATVGGTSGATYVFVRSGTTWSLQQKLLESGADPNSQLGASVSVDGNTTVAGAPQDSGLQGAAYVY